MLFRRQREKSLADLSHGFRERLDSLASARAHRNDRNAQRTLQRAHIDRDAQPRGFVHEVHAHDHAVRQLQNLEREAQRPLKARRVTDDDRAFRAALTQKPLRHRLLLRPAHERISTRQISQSVGLSLIKITALRQLDRFARPVAGVLTAAGQGVEHRAFSDIRIARKRHKPHAPSTSTQMRALSSQRSATIVPRKP